MKYLFPQDFMADPAAHVFGNRLYIYPSHDRNGGAAQDDDGSHFDMRDYHVLSLDDVESGIVIDHGNILDLDDIPWAGRQLWDNDVVELGGRYYMVFCVKDQCGIFRLGVAVSDRPEGPFVPQPDPIRGSYSIDPCLFKDNDGSIYCYFGGIWGGQLQWYHDNVMQERDYLPKGTERPIPSRVVRMTGDMLQFAEAPRPVLIIDDRGEVLPAESPYRFFEASWMHKYQGRYYFSYSTGDSHLLCYAVGDNPYGPFTFRGVLLKPVVGWTTHHSICEYRGRWYLFHHDSAPSGGITWLRSLKVAEIVYDNEGLITLK